MSSASAGSGATGGTAGGSRRPWVIGFLGSLPQVLLAMLLLLQGRGLSGSDAKLQSQLIADLLQVSQIISGKLPLDLEAVDLAPLLQAGIDAFRPAANAKAIASNLWAVVEVTDLLRVSRV